MSGNTIALGFRPTPGLAPNIDLGANIQTATNALQFQQGVQQVKNQNALKAILGQPGAVDENGNPTADAMQQVTAIDPNIGIALRQNALKSQGQQLQLSLMKSKAYQDKRSMMDDGYGEVDKIYNDAIKAGKNPEEAQRLADAELARVNEGFGQSGGYSDAEKRGFPTQYNPEKFKAFRDNSEQIRNLTNDEAKIAERAKMDAREKYGGVAEVEWTDEKGVQQHAPAQQDRATGQWVTADQNHTALPAGVQPFKQPAPGSVAEMRTLVAEDVAEDPDFKDKPPGLRAMEVERRIKQAQGGLASPEARHAEAEAIAGYQLAPLSPYSMNRAGGPELMAEVLKINPEYQAGRFAEVNDVMKKFGAGKEGDSVRFLNTAVQHVDALEVAGNALHNGGVPALAALRNSLSSALGQPAPKTFDELKGLVGSEVAKAVQGGLGSAGEREELKSQLSNANSPEQMQGVLNGLKTLLAGQAKGLKQQYEDGTHFYEGSPFAFNNKLLPATRKALGLVEGTDAGTKTADAGTTTKTDAGKGGGMTTLPSGTSDADVAARKKLWDGLKPGEQILAPDGTIRTKPGGASEAKPAEPAAPAATAGGVPEGATATNPKTGQRLVRKGGQWVPDSPTVPFEH